MSDLRTNFAGLELKNPIIVSSSGLTNSAEKNKKLEEAGAGAVVLKSIFEEQIMLQAQQMQNPEFSEGSDYLGAYIRSHSLNEYISLIRETKKICSIPVIASINCFSDTEWVEFARTMELAGADALELNILAIQTEPIYKYGSFEQQHINTLSDIKKQVNIPIIVKLGSNLTNPVALINQLYANGAEAVVLFNRFYQPDINIDKMEYTSGEVFSHPGDIATSLRWIGISSAAVDQIDYAASGGISTGADLIKVILAGASAAEICSTIFLNGKERIRYILENALCWMQEKGYDQINQFKGLMNARQFKGINTYERTQFLKYFGEKE